MLGRFGKPSLEPVEAFLIIILSAAKADGFLEEYEQNMIVNILSRMTIFEQYSGNMEQLFDKGLTIINQKGSEQALKIAISMLPTNLHDTAFAVAADLIMSDGHVTDTEQNTLARLAEALSVPKMKALKIIEVMAIKNKG